MSIFLLEAGLFAASVFGVIAVCRKDVIDDTWDALMDPGHKKRSLKSLNKSKSTGICNSSCICCEKLPALEDSIRKRGDRPMKKKLNRK